MVSPLFLWEATASTTLPLNVVAAFFSATLCYLLGTSNIASTFAGGMFDLVTFVISVNASGIEFATF